MPGDAGTVRQGLLKRRGEHCAAFQREAARRLDIRAVQVDGSEFMVGFDEECRALGVALLVLPPRTPQINGIVGRAKPHGLASSAGAIIGANSLAPL